MRYYRPRYRGIRFANDPRLQRAAKLVDAALQTLQKEVQFPLEDALDELKDYVKTNPGNDKAEMGLASCNEVLNETKKLLIKAMRNAIIVKSSAR